MLSPVAHTPSILFAYVLVICNEREKERDRERQGEGREIYCLFVLFLTERQLRFNKDVLLSPTHPTCFPKK